MLMKKNIKVGKIEFKFLFLTLFLLLNLNTNLSSSSDLEGSITEIKVLDKISSKNILVKLRNLLHHLMELLQKNRLMS